MPTDASYTIADLARLTGLNVRTIRYYIAQGLIPASGEAGPGAHYGEGHLDRLRLTKRLQAQHLPLSEIRVRLSALTDDEVAGLLAAAGEEREGPQTSALDYVRSLLGNARWPESKPTTSTQRAPTPTARATASMTSLSESAVSFVGAANLMPIGKYRRAEIGMDSATDSAADGGAEGSEGATDSAADSGAHTGAAQGPTVPAMPRMRDVPARPPTAAERPSIEPQSPERSQWDRLSLGPNIELHVRRPLSRLEQRRVERLITIARQVLKEDGV